MGAEEREDPEAALGSPSEDRKDATTEACLTLLLKHSKPTAQLVSALLSSRDCVGMAWWILVSSKKAKLYMPLRSIDLSECKVNARRVFSVLEWLSNDTEEITLGPSLVSGASFEFLRRFLETLGGGEEGCARRAEDSQRAHLRSLVFAEGSLGSREIRGLFEVLHPSLEVLSLKDGTPELADLMREGRASSLKGLCFDDATLQPGLLQHLFTSCREARPALRLETLSLCGVWMSGWIQGLCDSISAGAFPLLRTLRLNRAGIAGCQSMEILTRTIRGGHLGKLENLELEKNPLDEQSLVDLAGVCRSSFLPRLRFLNLNGGRMSLTALGSTETGTKEVFEALTDEGRPEGFKRVHFATKFLSNALAEGIWGGRFPFLKVCTLVDHAAMTFAEASLRAEAIGPPDLSELDIHLSSRESPASSRPVAALVGSGRLSSCLHGLFLNEYESLEEEGEVSSSLLESFRTVSFPHLKTLSLILGPSSVLRNSIGLGEGLERGHLPSLQNLIVRGKGLDREGTEALMKAASLGHLPSLEQLVVAAPVRPCNESAMLLRSALERGHLSRMRQLSLPHFGLGDSELIEISKAFSSSCLTALESLDLSFNSISDDGVRGFVGALRDKTLSRLSSLNLTLNAGVRREAGEVLATALNEGKLVSLRQNGKYSLKEGLELGPEAELGFNGAINTEKTNFRPSFRLQSGGLTFGNLGLTSGGSLHSANPSVCLRK